MTQLLVMIPFTDREMQIPWRENFSASDNDNMPRCNTRRLLLFYAVECGLKAVLMKRQGYNRTDLCPDIPEAKHDINKLLDSLHAGRQLKLPRQINMNKIKIRGNIEENRVIDPGKINQMWGYGGKSLQPTDAELEYKLTAIAGWIRRELGGTP